MKKAVFKFFVWFVTAFALAVGARGGALTNNFDVSRDYVANGIVGDTNWDGVYLSFGDIPNGNAGGSGNGRTIFADANNTFGGYFSVRTTAGDWAGAGDDGFFLYKVVSGDFDVSVQSAPTWQTPANHFAGLLVRAYQTNNSGAPFGISNTNGAENWIALMRGQEFNIFEMRRATNGGDAERTFPDPIAGTNDTRYWRIVRSQDTNFMFFWKINAVDNWVQLTNGTDFPQGVYKRPDLAGVKMQVGINQALFSGNQATAFFTDFELSGPNVNPVDFSTLGAPSGIVTTATNIGGSLTFSWNVGTPGDSSLVIMRSRGNIQVSPSQGLTYTANSAFGTANTLLGAGEFVVYSGTGNSVTVTNLGANNVPYAIAVYEYTNTGATTIYNTASPATNSFAGPGVITAASLSVPQKDIPVPGAVAIRLIASFSTGETSDQTANATWGSSDTTVATVDAAGAVTAVTNGATTITGTFGAFVLSTNITVHSIALVDDFSATQNYLTSGLQGSMYDGLFMNFGDVPGAVAGADGNGATTVLDSQITTTNGLSMYSNQSDWQGTANDGPFLFKIVPGSRNSVSGDFEAALQIVTMNTVATASIGLMARLYDPTTAAAGPGGAENHVNYWKVQNGTTAVRRTQAGGNTTFVAAGPAAGNVFLLLQRVSTNFYFFERATSNAPWTFVTNIVLAAATNNAPMEVGIAEETRSGVTAIASVRSFQLDAAGVVSTTPAPPAATNLTMTLNGNLSMTLNWFAADSLGNPVQSIAVMRANGPVTTQPSLGQPLTASSVFGTAASGLGGGNFVVFVSAASPASTNNSITVTGLQPGVTYYAAIYTFVGSGGTKVFNNVLPPTGASANLTDGFLIGVTGSLVGGIPRGGIGQLLVQGIYTGGVLVDKSSSATVIFGDTNIIKILGSTLTGITNGVAPITNSFGGFTNVAFVTVREPLFSDNFTNAQDYLASGVAGTGWDDMYNPGVVGTPIPVPGSLYVPLANSGATVVDANISTNNMLTMMSSGDGWENGAAGGFFLFKYVSGDFQTAVHINSFNVAGFNQPGLLARAYASSNGVIGLPLSSVLTNAVGTLDGGEYWVDFARFDEFSIGTYARRNIDSVVSQNGQPDLGDTNYWLLIIRTQGTNFNFYKRLNPTDPWKRTPNNVLYQLPQFAGRAMQVGLMAGPWTGTSGNQNTVRFENYMLDYTAGSTLSITSSGGNVTLTWPPNPHIQLQSTTSLNPVNWQPVSGTPTLDTIGYNLTLPATNAATFFRLVQ